MSFSCQFCGEIDESEVVLRCRACSGENVKRDAFGNKCANCEDSSSFAMNCPVCGSEELEM